MKVYVFLPPVIAEVDGRVRGEQLYVHNWPSKLWDAVRAGNWPGIIDYRSGRVQTGWWFGTADVARAYARAFIDDQIQQIDETKAIRNPANDLGLTAIRAALVETLERYERDSVPVHWLDDAAT